jgi:hypothetical protein
MPDWTTPGYNNGTHSLLQSQIVTIFLSKPASTGNEIATVVLELGILSDKHLWTLGARIALLV